MTQCNIVGSKMFENALAMEEKNRVLFQENEAFLLFK